MRPIDIDSINIYYEDPYLYINFIGNVGYSKKTVSNYIQQYGLPSLDILSEIPSFEEKGSPDYLYKAKVPFNDLPSEVRLNIARTICKQALEVNIFIDSVDARLEFLEDFSNKLLLISKCLE